MKSKIKAVYGKVKASYEKIVSKRYSTLAGTLVFFMLLSVIPFLFVATLLFGAFNINYSVFLELEIFSAFKKVLDMLITTAENAGGGTSIFFILTALYSSTNLFYHMRRSGEIIYNYRRKKKGILIRLSAAAFVFIIMIIIVTAGSVFFPVQTVLSKILPSFYFRALVYAVLIIMAFIVAVLLNLYICPYKTGIKSFLKGSLLTLIFWSVSTVLFSLYVKYFSSYERLYGALALIMVFLLFLHLVMQGLVIGVIYNMESVKRKNDKTF